MQKFRVIVDMPRYESIVEAPNQQEALSIAEEKFCQELEFSDCIKIQEA